MQINAFADERMKILYVLSFMSGGMAQVWAANKTSMTLAIMSKFNTLEVLLMSIKKSFGDPDRERMALCNKLMHRLQSRVVENQPVFEREFTSEMVSWQLK